MLIFALQVPRHDPRFQELNKRPYDRPKRLKTLYSTQSEHPQGVFLNLLFWQKQKVINGQRFGRCFPLHPPFFPCWTILVGRIFSVKWTGVQPVALRLGVIVLPPFQREKEDERAHPRERGRQKLRASERERERQGTKQREKQGKRHKERERGLGDGKRDRKRDAKLIVNFSHESDFTFLRTPF